MKKWLMGVAGGLVLGMSAMATDVVLKPNHPDTYVVVKGDTLWDISGRFLNEPWLWPEIWQVNPQIENPHLIFPGDVLSLVYVDGSPRLRVSRGELSNTVKLGPSVRSEPADNAIPAIPLDKINAFMRDSRFVNPGDLEDAPYVVAGAKTNIVSGAGDLIYGRGEFPPGRNVFGIFREGTLFRDPATGEVLGIQAIDIGEAKKVDQQGDVSTLKLNRTTQEVRNGDRLLPNMDRPLTAEFHPSAPQEDLSGVILGVEGGVSQVGAMNVVMVNLGSRDGLEPGNVMSIYKIGETVKDHVANSLVKLPDVRGGLLMYFSVFERMSYALVLKADQVLQVGDRVEMP